MSDYNSNFPACNMNFMLITNEPELAHYAESCGVSRIFIDLEKIGKQERQGHLDTLMSNHTVSDVAKIKKCLSMAELLVRVNPLYDGTKKEVDDAISGGADWLMLPMFRRAEEVEQFVALVDGRAKVIPLLETYEASQCLDEIVCIPGISEIYIGLNDLHLDMGLTFMFELLANGTIDELVKIIKDAGIFFGFGGIARVGEGVIPGELIMGEHHRLGSSSVILSRTFHRKSMDVFEFKANLDLKVELEKLIMAGEKQKLRNDAQVLADHRHLQNVVTEFTGRKLK